GVLALVGTIGAVANCAVTWAGPQRGRWWPKIAETLIALAGLAFSWILLAFGLVNFNIHY
ncbi:MAG: hypothetical protein ACREM6_02390, partial [Vulcanimicrobiaceae bacterium]